MSDLIKRSSWWLFLLLFGLTIGTIQLFGWWTRQAHAAPERIEVAVPTKHVQACELHHWRSMVMQQQ
jgi:hypothetical protein